MRLTQAEWDEWCINPVSVQFRSWLAGQVSETLESWERSSRDRPTEQIGADTLFARGRIDAIRTIMGVELIDLNSGDER